MGDIIKIDRLGHHGDGIGQLNGKPVFVPFSLASETVELSGQGALREIASIRSVSPDRTEPFCDLFGKCGGCQLQHMKTEPYLAWKTSLLVEAFSREGLEIDLEPIRHYPRQSRRRAVLNAKKTPNGFYLGFLERGSNQLIDLDNCPIIAPTLNNALEGVRELIAIIAPKKGDVRINLLECANGVDLALTFKGSINNKLILDLTSHPAVKGFIRLSVNGEIIFESQKPVLKVGLASVFPPPEAFVQAVKGAETDMVKLAASHLEKCKKVADLFSGFGTFALRLAENSQVFAAESNADALAAMDRAWRETGGKLKALTHEKRDLFRRPMNVAELKHFDGAVFDPPRAGAEAQARELAKSKLKKIVAVSCNPQTLARDVKILNEGGFKISSVTPIDQFAFTPHLEAVVLLER